MHIPKKSNMHNALWNIAAISSIVAILFKNQVYTIGSTVFVTAFHVVVLFINDDLV